ncbi:MAG: MEKHLA domain-containing protein [Xenococcaceae cyanobacterium]
MSEEIWSKPEIVTWTQIILDSYHKLIGKELIERKTSAIERSRTLYFAPFVVVSHGTQTNPIFNYGNQTALNLWEVSWDVFTKTPSRQPVEPMEREERERMLMQVNTQGFIDNYRGIRISNTGRRFSIENTVVWNLIDAKGDRCGQAATFSEWDYLS